MNSETAILKKKPVDDAKKKFKRRPLYSSMKKQLDDDSSSEDERKPEDLLCTVSKEVELDVDTVDNAKEFEEAHNFNEADLAIAN